MGKNKHKKQEWSSKKENTPQTERVSQENTPQTEPTTQNKNDADRVLEYLQKNGASLSIQIARSLEMETSAVVKSLRELRKDGRIHLR